MNDGTLSTQQWLTRWTSEPYAYLTTRGRRSGQPHRIEIWFAVEGELMYLMAGGRDRSDWVRNLQADPHLTVELGDETRTGTAEIQQEGTSGDQRARELLVNKYRDGDNLEEWGRNSLPIVIEFSS